MTSKVALIDGLPVHYLDTGRGETVLYLHGAGGRPPAGASFVPMLAESHRLLLPSRPGFDDSPIGECRTLVDVAKVMCAFIDTVAREPVHLIGQSAGAGIACWIAILRPDLVKSLIASAPSLFEVRYPAPAGQSGPPGPQELEHRLYGDTPAWTEPPSDEDRGRIQRNAASYMKWSHGGDTKRDIADRLGEIAAPTLIIWATHDRMMKPESAAPFQKKIATCYRVLIYGAAHELPISAADRWVGLVSDFIARKEGFVVAKSSAPDR